MTQTNRHEMVVKRFAELTTGELYEILKARFAVFVVEQRCFYLDMDDIDPLSIHVFLREGQRVVAYARLFPEREAQALLPPETPPMADDADDCVWHVGRMLTTRRGEGLGRRIMEEVVRTAWAQGATLLRMEAQSHAVGFYERLGFQVCSPEFEEAGIPHVRMQRRR